VLTRPNAGPYFCFDDARKDNRGHEDRRKAPQEEGYSRQLACYTGAVPKIDFTDEEQRALAPRLAPTTVPRVYKSRL
jgi:hypothetical protein